MLSKIREMRETLQVTLDSFTQWLQTQSAVAALCSVSGAHEARAQRIIARWQDKGVNPMQAIRALAYTGSYRQAVAVGKLSPQEFAEWHEKKAEQNG